MMPAGGRGSTYRYIGAEPRTTADGWESVGDMGYVDDEEIEAHVRALLTRRASGQ